jgi:hypothetical protein
MLGNSLYRVRSWTRLGGIGQLELKNKEDLVRANRESTSRDAERTGSGERKRKK